MLLCHVGKGRGVLAMAPVPTHFWSRSKPRKPFDFSLQDPETRICHLELKASQTTVRDACFPNQPGKVIQVVPLVPSLPTDPAAVHSGVEVGSHRGFQISFTEFVYLKGDRNHKLGAICASIVLLLNPVRGCDTFQLLPGLQLVQWHTLTDLWTAPPICNLPITRVWMWPHKGDLRSCS